MNRTRATRSVPLAAVCLAALTVGWCVLFSVLVVQRHDHLGTFDFDLGIHDQSIWLLSRWSSFCTVRGLPVFGHHATFGYLLLVPFWWVGAGPNFLNVVHTAAIASGALALYAVARELKLSPWPAAALGFAWLCNPSLQYFAWESFHPENMAATPLLLAYLAARRRQWGWYWLALLAALIWKEDVALFVGALGVVLAVRGERRIGALTVAGATAWFALFGMVMVPQLAGGGTVYGALYGTLGDTPTEVVQTAVTDPGAVTERLGDNNAVGYAVRTTAPFAFSALFSPLPLLLGLPQALINLLSTADFTFDFRYHYQLLPIVAVALASVEGVARLSRWRRFGPVPNPLRRSAAVVVAAAALAASIDQGISPIGREYENGWWMRDPRAGAEQVRAALERVAPDDGVAVTYYVVPQLSRRPVVYTFPNPWRNLNYGISASALGDPAKVRWLIVDRAASNADDLALYDRLTAPDGDFVPISSEDGILVAKRGRT